MIDEQKYLSPRSRTVVKANELIQKSRFNLSLQQQKIVLYLISQITPYDKDFRVYEFSITEFCKVCGIDDTSGGNYSTLKAAIKEIADKSLWITIDEQETLLRWIEKPYINRNSGTIRIRLDEDMKPYLLQLQQNFTKYELLWTLHFKSKYSVRLYEVIKSVHFKELESYVREFDLDELRRLLGAEKYTTYQTLKTRVLMPACKEINEYSDKILTYEPIKKSKAVAKIRFTIASKGPIEILELKDKIEKEYDLNQLTLWDTLQDKGYV